MAVSLNKLAENVAKVEKGKKEVNVAQIKNVLGALGIHLRTLSAEDAAEVLRTLVCRAGKKSRAVNR